MRFEDRLKYFERMFIACSGRNINRGILKFYAYSDVKGCKE